MEVCAPNAPVNKNQHHQYVFIANATLRVPWSCSPKKTGMGTPSWHADAHDLENSTKTNGCRVADSAEVTGGALTRPDESDFTDAALNSLPCSRCSDEEPVPSLVLSVIKEGNRYRYVYDIYRYRQYEAADNRYDISYWVVVVYIGGGSGGEHVWRQSYKMST